MNDLRAVILAAIPTRSGTAWAVRLDQGTINVGDTVGLYSENNDAWPVTEAKVTDIRHRGAGKLTKIANQALGSHQDHLNALYMESEYVIKTSYTIGPNKSAQAVQFGLTEDELDR